MPFRSLAPRSSNQPITDIVKVIGPDRTAAIAVRMPTIPADAGHGVLNTLPAGCSDGAEAIRQITLLAEQHYGWAGRAFIDRLEYQLATSFRRKTLERIIKRMVTEFKEQAHVSGEQGEINRVADMFAVVLIAIRLARRWQIVSLNGYRTSILKVYRRYLARLPRPSEPAVDQNPIERVRNYVTRRRSELYQLDGTGYPDLTDQALDRAAGFLRTAGGATWLVIRAARWSAEFGSDARLMLDDLLSKGRLRATDGYRCQVKIRQSKPKDGVYCVKID
jgi:hypothetical protein